MEYISESEQQKDIFDAPEIGSVWVHYHDYVEDLEDTFLCVSVSVERLECANYGAVICTDKNGKQHNLGAYSLPRSMAIAHHIADNISDEKAKEYTFRKYHIWSVDDENAVELE